MGRWGFLHSLGGHNLIHIYAVVTQKLSDSDVKLTWSDFCDLEGVFRDSF